MPVGEAAAGPAEWVVVGEGFMAMGEEEAPAELCEVQRLTL